MGDRNTGVADRLEADAARMIDALQSELRAVRDGAQRYKRITEEMGVIMGRLRDERDRYRLDWESVSAELRRLTRPRAVVASSNGSLSRTAKGQAGPASMKSHSSALR